MFHLENIKLCSAMSFFVYIVISGTLQSHMVCVKGHSKASSTRGVLKFYFFLQNNESQAIDSGSSDPSVVFLTREVPGC